jgi:hypothetical protein
LFVDLAVTGSEEGHAYSMDAAPFMKYENGIPSPFEQGLNVVFVVVDIVFLKNVVVVRCIDLTIVALNDDT